MAFTVERAFSLIESAHRRERLAHAFLVSGARGSGKEALAARVIAMLRAGAAEPDLLGEVASEEARPLDEMAGEGVRVLRPHSKSRRITVDHIRELERSVHVVAGPRAWKVGVIVDAERMVPAAENAFLKTLEEPPPRTLLMLLSTNPGGLLPTVLSRCVRMPLMGRPRLEEGGGAELVAGLAAVAGDGWGTTEGALGLKGLFAQLMAERRAEAVGEAEELLKEEEKRLKQATEGDWLKRREEELKAVAESRYLTERARLLEVMQAWLADLLRIKSGVGGLDFPAQREVLAALAERESLPALLGRMEAVESLRATLETNAQEQLALEVGMLGAFG